MERGRKKKVANTTRENPFETFNPTYQNMPFNGQPLNPQLASFSDHRKTQAWIPFEMSPFEMWPDGYLQCFYTAEDACTHQSGWAMRNTNNHDSHRLKKSCLGVMICSESCRNVKHAVKRPSMDQPLVHIRPYICDKARLKQKGSKCPTKGCNGVLVQQKCTGHAGKPVTHLWKTDKNIVFFQAKGVHDHPKPNPKPSGSGKKRLKDENNINRSGKKMKLFTDKRNDGETVEVSSTTIEPESVKRREDLISRQHSFIPPTQPFKSTFSSFHQPLQPSPSFFLPLHQHPQTPTFSSHQQTAIFTKCSNSVARKPSFNSKSNVSTIFKATAYNVDPNSYSNMTSSTYYPNLYTDTSYMNSGILYENYYNKEQHQNYLYSSSDPYKEFSSFPQHQLAPHDSLFDHYKYNSQHSIQNNQSAFISMLPYDAHSDNLNRNGIDNV